MNELALFAGAGGGILAGKLLGWRTVCAVEINEFCQNRLIQRQEEGHLPFFPVWDDVQTFDGSPWCGVVDIVSAGFPCQPFSTSGKRKGPNDERNMWPETIRIIREVRPLYVFLENVPAILVPFKRNGRKEQKAYYGRVLGDLAEAGFHAGWDVLGGKKINGLCDGERVWILASTNREFLESLDIQKSIITYSEESRRREHSRTVCSMLSQDDYTRIKRDSDVVACGMERLKAIGNGQNPAVAATAFRLLSARMLNGGNQ